MKQDAPKTLSIGIDIGGTTTKLGIVDQNGHLLARRALDTQRHQEAQAFSAELAAAVGEVMDSTGTKALVTGIGIGAPGVDERAGTIAAAANLPFQEPFALAAFLEDALGMPAKLIKDSSAAIIGERVFGGAKGMEHFVLLTLGTGLGSAIMINGHVISGANGLASEYGHSLAVPHGRQCNCGKSGCLETYVSATGIKRTVFELLAGFKGHSRLRDYTYHALDAKMIYEAARSGDDVAREAFRQTGAILGRAITNLIVLLDPQAIFLAGGLTQAEELLLLPVRESVDEHLLGMFKGSCEIAFSHLGGEDTGILGAAAMMWYNPGQ
jgi:glucokinase